MAALAAAAALAVLARTAAPCWVGARHRCARGLRLARAAESGDGSQGQLWLDLRLRSNVREMDAKISAGSASIDGTLKAPDVNTSLMELFTEVKNKFDSIGVALPQGQGVDAILVEEEVHREAQEKYGGAGVPIFYYQDHGSSMMQAGMMTPVADGARKGGMGTRMPTGDTIIGFLCSAETGEKVGGLSLPSMAGWRTGAAREVKDLWNLQDFQAESIPDDVTPFGTVMPQDAQLWASALMRRAKQAGLAKTGYALKSKTAGMSVKGVTINSEGDTA